MYLWDTELKYQNPRKVISPWHNLVFLQLKQRKAFYYIWAIISLLLIEQRAPQKIIIYQIWLEDQITTSLPFTKYKASVTSHKEFKKKKNHTVIQNVFITTTFFQNSLKI